MGATGRGRRWCELSYADRYYIEVSLKNGKTAAQIARDLSRARSTIVREVRRGMCEQRRSGRKRTVRVYKADYAQLVHDRRRAKCGAKIKLGHDHETAAALEEYVVDRGYSPYAAIEAARAAGRLATSVCTTTFYSYIRKGVLGFGEEQLIRGFMPRKRRNAPGLFEDRCQTKHRARGGRSIEERPRAVLSRLEFGHWEGDLVVSAQGGKAAVLTLLERKTRYLIATRVDDKKVSSVAAALDLLEKRWGPSFGSIFKSVTFDNGSEFKDAFALRRSAYAQCRGPDGEGGRLGDVYYAHPYCSSERGSNENANGMIRRAFPKGTVFDDVSQEQIDAWVAWINAYPRRILGGKCATAMFNAARAA